MSTVINPVTVTITDANVTAQNVTSFLVKVGTTTGGPYTTSQASIPVSSLTPGANGAFSGSFSALTFSPALSSGTVYFAVAEAVNAAGDSANSPEVTFELEAVPSPPTGFSVA